MLNTLWSLTRLPGQIIDGMQATIETAQLLPGLQHTVTSRLGSLDQSVRDVLALLPAIADDLERVRATVEPQHERVVAIERTVARLEVGLTELAGTLQVIEDDVEDATDRLPDPDAPGPLARARETLTGRSS